MKFEDFGDTEIITRIPDSIRGNSIIFNQVIPKNFDYSSTSNPFRPWGHSKNDFIIEYLIAGDCFRQAKLEQYGGLHLIMDSYPYNSNLMKRWIYTAGYDGVTLWSNKKFRKLKPVNPEIVIAPHHKLNIKKPLVLFYGSSGESFAKETFEELQRLNGKDNLLAKLDIQFEEKTNKIEMKLPSETDLKGRDVHYIQCFYDPTQPEKSINDNLMEAMLFSYFAKKAGAGRVVGIFPHFAYDRQDWRKDREPLSMRLMADLLHVSGYDELATFALHSPSSEGSFNRRFYTDIIPIEPILIKALKDEYGSDWYGGYVSSTDAKGGKWARNIAEDIKARLNIGTKFRPEPQKVDVFFYLKHFTKVKRVVGIDDSCAAGDTLLMAYLTAMDKNIGYFGAGIVHPYMNKDKNKVSAFEKLKDIPLLVSNSVPHSKEVLGMYPNVKVYSICPLAAEVINRIHTNGSLRKLYLQKK